MKTMINKSEVMRKAHELFNSEIKLRNTAGVLYYRWKEALRIAWRIIKFKTRVPDRIVLISYKKLDGTERTALATLRNDLLPQFTTTTTHKSKTNNEVQVYFDLDKQAWRSFRIENLLRVI